MTEPAEMSIAPKKRSPWRNLSLVWLVPVLALVATLGIAWQSFADRGVLIEISFQNAQGVLAEETTLRYRDVVIGRVEEVEFSEDLSRVEVGVRVDKEIQPFIDEDANFWVVRPQVTSRGIEGLSTVLSGVHIEGAWDEVAGTPTYFFEGLETPPLVQPGRPGKRITLRTENGTTISQGAPVSFRGVEVGRLEQPRLTVTGDAVLVDAFIEAPHDQFLTEATRFWDTSGFTVSLGTQGFALDFDSLASIVSGGLAFDSVYFGGRPVEAGHIYDIYPEEDAARRSLFARSSVGAIRLSVVFDESVAGLRAGAPVTYKGLAVGQVEGLLSQVEETEDGPVLSLVVNISVEPDSLGFAETIPESEFLDFFEAAVANGLRARLGTQSLLSRDLIVELVELPDAEPAVFERDGTPHPTLPTADSVVPDVTATAEGLLNRVNALPLEEVLDQAISLMESIEIVVRAEGTQQTPDAVLALVQDTRALIAAEETQALPGELGAIVSELRAVVQELREGGAVDSLARALRNVDRIAADVAVASEEVPGLIEDVRALTQKATALEAEALLAEAQSTLTNVNAFLDDEAIKALPPKLGAAVDGVVAALSDLREGGAIASLSAALAELETISRDIAAGSGNFPTILEDVQRLTERTAALDTEGLVQSAQEVLDSANRFISSDETQELPPALAGALAEVELALAELREGNAVANVNATLDSARGAADAIAQAANDLPQLSARLNRLVSQGEALVASYSGTSQFNAETLDVLREMRRAARSVSELARAIERSPNSLIFGR